MLNKKGSTLIEGLLAFEIFISVLVIYTSLFSTIYQQEYILQNKFENLIEEESDVLYINNFSEIIKEVLP